MVFLIKRYGLLLSVISFSIFLGCDILDPEKRELKPIEGNIIFNIQEGYQQQDAVSKPDIILKMVTEKIYLHFNHSIIADQFLGEDWILTDLQGISIPLILAPALGPARYSSFLDIPVGEYSVYFSYMCVTDRYLLTVTDSYIKVTEDAAQFTHPEFNLFWRYPPNSFVYLCRTTDETAWIVEDFLDTLLGQINLERFQFPDTGEIPYPRSYTNTIARYFFYENEEDFDRAGEILESYTQDVIVHHPGVSISLINWKNKRHLSRLF